MTQAIAQRMKRQRITLAITAMMLLLFLQGCGFYDLRTKSIKKEGITAENEQKGKALLQAAWKKQGFDKLKNHSVYAYHAHDEWRGMLAKMVQLWPEMVADLDLKYRAGTFDGQIQFASGKQMGNYVGLQNWNYYEILKGDTVFKERKSRFSKRNIFGISAFQYFNELIDRLKDVPIISYAGEKEFRGQMYDLVFCTWHQPKPHKENDQYMAWINQKTGLMEFTQYSIREPFKKLPGGKMIGGGIEFADLKEIEGIMIPQTQIVYAIKIGKKQKGYLHKITVTDFQFDGFDVKDLQIDPKIDTGGNFK